MRVRVKPTTGTWLLFFLAAVVASVLTVWSILTRDPRPARAAPPAPDAGTQVEIEIGP